MAANFFTGFVDGLNAGANLQNTWSQRRLRGQQGEYYGALTAQQELETEEASRPESRAAVLKKLQGDADLAFQAARQAQINADQSERENVEWEEFAPYRRRNAESAADRLRTDADQADLAYQKANLDFLEYSSPQARARREYAEQLALQGDYAAAAKEAIAVQQQFDGMTEYRRQQAVKRAQWHRNRGEEVPESVLNAAEMPNSTFLDDFQRRFDFNVNQYAQAGVTPQQAVPATPQAQLQRGALPDVNMVADYIQKAATARGMDPQVALTVARAEGLKPNTWQSNVVSERGNRETSFGPFQLLVSQPGEPGGLGDEFMRRTGLDPRDPNTWQQQVDFALDMAKQGGWSPWYGAAAAGVGNWQGIDPNAPDVPMTASAPTGAGLLTAAEREALAAGPPAGPTRTARAAVPAAGTPAPPPTEPATTGSIINEMGKVGVTQAMTDAGMMQPAGVPTAEQIAGARDFYLGQGGMDPYAMRGLQEFTGSWDPQAMTSGGLNLLDSATLYQMEAEFGTPENAKALAGKLVRSHLAESNRWNAMARAAAATGDTEGAANYLMKQAAAIPADVDATFELQDDGDYMLTFTNGRGQEVHREIVNPDKILSTVMGMTPRDSIRYMYAMADMKPPSEVAGRIASIWADPGQALTEEQMAGLSDEDLGRVLSEAEKARATVDYSPDELEKAMESVGAAMSELVGAETGNMETGAPALSGFAVDPHIPEVKELIGTRLPDFAGIAARTALKNNMAGRDAVQAIFGPMMTIDPTRLGLEAFEAEQDESNGDYVINADGSPTFRMSQRDYEYLMQQRDTLIGKLWDTQQQGRQAEIGEAVGGPEAERRRQAGATVIKGQEAQQLLPMSREEFAEAWRHRQRPTQGYGAGAGLPTAPEDPAVDEAMLEEAWQQYLASQPRSYDPLSSVRVR